MAPSLASVQALVFAPLQDQATSNRRAEDGPRRMVTAVPTAVLRDRQIAAGRGDRLRPEPVEGADPLRRRWPDRNRLQHRRALDETDCAQSQECTVRWPRP